MLNRILNFFKKDSDESADGPDRSNLVPRIKVPAFTQALRDMGMPEDQIPLTEPLVADLLVTYAFDLPSAFMMASPDAIAGLGIAPHEIRALSLANLKRHTPQIGVEDVGPFHRVVTMGENLQACTLLATKFWEQIAAQAPGEVIAAVPSRDVVLFTSSDAPESIEAMRALIPEVMEQAAQHSLSERLLVWRGGRWQEFVEG